jgi:hypothetical protein
MANGPIFIDTKKIDRLAIELKGFEEEVAESTYHALNRTLDHVVTKVGQIIPKTYAIKASEVKKSFKGGIKKPSKTNLSASLTSKGHTLSIAHFPHTPSTPQGKKGKIKVKIKKTDGSKEVKTKPKAFLASTGALSEDKIQYNVFRREGKARLPIVVLRTLSIPQMITNEGVAEQIQKIATEKLGERLEHEITHRMTSMSKRVK